MMAPEECAVALDHGWEMSGAYSLEIYATAATHLRRLATIERRLANNWWYRYGHQQRRRAQDAEDLAFVLGRENHKLRTQLTLAGSPYIDIMPEWSTKHDAARWAYLCKRFADDRTKTKLQLRRVRAALDEAKAVLEDLASQPNRTELAAIALGRIKELEGS